MMRDWKRVSRDTVYANDWIEVFDDRVIRPDGQPGVYGVVHFLTQAAAIVPFDPARGVLLVGQERYTLERYSWEIPQGGVALDDDLLDGAKRELMEETGLIAERWTQLLTSELSNSTTDEVGGTFLAEGLTETVPRPEGTEKLRLKWADLDDALRMGEVGEIRDLPSQAGLLAAARHLASR